MQGYLGLKRGMAGIVVQQREDAGLKPRVNMREDALNR